MAMDKFERIHATRQATLDRTKANARSRNNGKKIFICNRCCEEVEPVGRMTDCCDGWVIDVRP